MRNNIQHKCIRISSLLRWRATNCRYYMSLRAKELHCGTESKHYATARTRSPDGFWINHRCCTLYQLRCASNCAISLYFLVAFEHVSSNGLTLLTCNAVSLLIVMLLLWGRNRWLWTRFGHILCATAGAHKPSKAALSPLYYLLTISGLNICDSFLGSYDVRPLSHV